MNDVRELYELYNKDIYRFSLYLCGNVADAEDITAETFVRAIATKSVLVTSTVKGYLLTIARNLYLEGRRYEKYSNGGSIENDDQQITQSLEHAHELSADLNRTLCFLQEVVEVDRSALLFRVDGLSYREIATVLNISVISAKVKVHRLRAQLMELTHE